MAEPHQPANANNSSSSSNNVVVSTNAWTGQATSSSAATNAWSSNQISVSAVPSVSVMPITTSVTTVPTMNAVPVASSTTVTASVSNATTSAVPMGSATTSNMTIAQPAVLSNTASTAGTSLSSGAPVSTHPIQGSPSRATLRPNVGTDPTKVLDKVRVADLVREVDSNTQLDEDVEELLVQLADDFIDNVVSSAAQFAKHRKASSIECRDVQMHLERSWNMKIPGFGSSEEPKPYKRSATTEAHKQRMALIKKSLKKY